MIYILLIWTVVGYGGATHSTSSRHDWRPLGEFHMEDGRMGKKTAQEMCEAAAQRLRLNPENYRCVRSK
jgi:hypothetical protein